MKYVVVLADGMADLPIKELNHMTPLEYAATPNMDALARGGIMGMVKTVPDSMKPGSDVANLAVMGYDPLNNYSGRSPLEALSVGVSMKETDIIFRCNIVTVSEEEPYAEKTIIDHSSGEISTEDADILMDAVRAAFNNETFEFYTGTSYRHIMVWHKGDKLDLSQPHDHLGCVVKEFLPSQPELLAMMKQSYEILNNHPLNLERAANGKRKANCLWFWGAGTKPTLQSFQEKTGLKGAMISAVDLLKGIAVGAKMQVINVSGANGGLYTNYEGKAKAAVKTLLEDGNDFVYVHVEAPDEMGHSGNAHNKVLSIENVDSKIVKIIQDDLDNAGVPYRMLILPDHPTPIRIRTHTGNPVPFLLYDSTHPQKKKAFFSEKEGETADVFVAEGYKLIDMLISNHI